MKQHAKGFTLIEIIVAATICSVVAVGLGAALMSGFRLWNRIKAPGAYTVDTVITLECIARQLRQIVAVSDKPEFFGDESHVSYVSASGNALVRYAYEFSFVQMAVMVKKSPFVDKDDYERDVETEYVLRAVDAFSVSYLRRANNNTFAWESSWEKKQGFPYAVRITGSQSGIPFQKTVFIPIMCRR